MNKPGGYFRELCFPRSVEDLKRMSALRLAYLMVSEFGCRKLPSFSLGGLTAFSYLILELVTFCLLVNTSREEMPK